MTPADFGACDSDESRAEEGLGRWFGWLPRLGDKFLLAAELWVTSSLPLSDPGESSDSREVVNE